MASTIDRIAELLASGLPPTLSASITGVSPSYISQLLKDPDFKELVNDLAKERVEKEATASVEDKEIKHYGNKLLGAEHKIVDHLLERIHMMEDRTAISALREIGARHDAMRKPTLGSVVAQMGNSGGTLRMIELSLPAVAAPDIMFGKNSEIVQIGNRSITPMPTAALQKIIDGTTLDAIEHRGHLDEQDFISQAIDSL